MLLEKHPFAGRRHASWRSDPRDLAHICKQTHVYSTPYVHPSSPSIVELSHLISSYLIWSHPISYHLILSIQSIYISACVMLYLVDCDLPKLWRCMCQSLADNCCVQGAIHKNGDSEYPVAARGDHHIFTLTFSQKHRAATDRQKREPPTMQTRPFLSDLQGMWRCILASHLSSCPCFASLQWP